MESEQGCPAPRAQSVAVPRVVTRTRSLRPRNVPKPKIAVSHADVVILQPYSPQGTQYGHYTTFSILFSMRKSKSHKRFSFCHCFIHAFCFFFACVLSLQILLFLLTSHPRTPRQLGPRQPDWMRQQMWSRSRVVWHPGLSQLRHLEL